jgi:beta-alanine--pyruvate transaminase
MGAVIASDKVYDTFMQGPEETIEFFHGYTYSGHPMAAAAACAALDLYQSEGIFENAAALSGYFEEAVHSLKGLPNVADIRNLGLVAGIELQSIPGKVGARAYDVFTRCFFDAGLLIRITGDTIALSPPLIINRAQIDELIEKLGKVIKTAA